LLPRAFKLDSISAQLAVLRGAQTLPGETERALAVKRNLVDRYDCTALIRTLQSAVQRTIRTLLDPHDHSQFPGDLAIPLARDVPLRRRGLLPHSRGERAEREDTLPALHRHSMSPF